MLYAEWNMDDALAVRYEEGLTEGIAEGHANEKLQIARNLLAEDSTPDFVQKITGLDLETIEELRN
jgi:predicted transposase YdaD